MANNMEVPEPGLVSAGTSFTDGNVHLISNYWGLNTFLDAPIPDECLKVVHITTASRRYAELGTNARFLDAERAWVAEKHKEGRIKAVETCVAGKTQQQIGEILSDADVIFMGGGNTPYLLQELQDTGANEIIKKMVEDGTWYLGKSAGAIVAGPDINPRGFFLPSMATREITDTTGLGVTQVYPFPHVDTPQAMKVEVGGQDGWEHALEMTLERPIAYIFDNKLLAGGIDVSYPV